MKVISLYVPITALVDTTQLVHCAVYHTSDHNTSKAVYIQAVKVQVDDSWMIQKQPSTLNKELGPLPPVYGQLF